MMTDEKMRGAFEAYKAKSGAAMIGAGEGERLRQILDLLCFADFCAGWQAYQSAVEIELPVPVPPPQAWNDDAQRIENARYSGYRQALRDCKDSIEALGLRVKP